MSSPAGSSPFAEQLAKAAEANSAQPVEAIEGFSFDPGSAITDSGEQIHLATGASDSAASIAASSSVTFTPTADNTVTVYSSPNQEPVNLAGFDVHTVTTVVADGVHIAPQKGPSCGEGCPGTCCVKDLGKNLELVENGKPKLAKEHQDAVANISSNEGPKSAADLLSKYSELAALPLTQPTNLESSAKDPGLVAINKPAADQKSADVAASPAMQGKVEPSSTREIGRPKEAAAVIRESATPVKTVPSNNNAAPKSSAVAVAREAVSKIAQPLARDKAAPQSATKSAEPALRRPAVTQPAVMRMVASASVNRTMQPPAQVTGVKPTTAAQSRVVLSTAAQIKNPTTPAVAGAVPRSATAIAQRLLNPIATKAAVSSMPAQKRTVGLQETNRPSGSQGSLSQRVSAVVSKELNRGMALGNDRLSAKVSSASSLSGVANRSATRILDRVARLETNPRSNPAPAIKVTLKAIEARLARTSIPTKTRTELEALMKQVLGLREALRMARGQRALEKSVRQTLVKTLKRVAAVLAKGDRIRTAQPRLARGQRVRVLPKAERAVRKVSAAAKEKSAASSTRKSRSAIGTRSTTSAKEKQSMLKLAMRKSSAIKSAIVGRASRNVKAISNQLRLLKSVQRMGSALQRGLAAQRFAKVGRISAAIVSAGVSAVARIRLALKVPTSTRRSASLSKSTKTPVASRVNKRSPRAVRGLSNQFTLATPLGSRALIRSRAAASKRGLLKSRKKQRQGQRELEIEEDVLLADLDSGVIQRSESHAPASKSIPRQAAPEQAQEQMFLSSAKDGPKTFLATELHNSDADNTNSYHSSAT